MIPLKQRNRHDPANGVWGDCHRAAVASVLELPLSEVPHFWDGGCEPAEAERRERDFLLSRGLVPLPCLYRGAPLAEVLDSVGTMCPGVYYLLGGTSKNGTGHTVVCLGKEIVHDPALDESGIVGPMKEDGFFWVTFFGSAVALHRPAA